MESRTETSALDDDIDAKLSEMSEEEIIDLAKKDIESIKILTEMQNIGKDVSEGLNYVKEKLLKYLDYITDINTKKSILETAKTEFKKVSYDFQSFKSR